MEIIKMYATKPHGELKKYLLSKSKNVLSEALVNLITMYINDRNSSTLREFITVTIAGYEHTESKIGYNGYKRSVYGRPLMCEAKPQNIRSEGRRKLNGGGNFTDYTHARFERDLKENLNILVSGFVDGRLIYILEFPFKCDSFASKLKRQLNKRFPKGDISGQFLRSARFDYRDYISCEGLKIVYCLPRSELEKHKNHIVRGLYEFLIKNAKDT